MFEKHGSVKEGNPDDLLELPASVISLDQINTSIGLLMPVRPILLQVLKLGANLFEKMLQILTIMHLTLVPKCHRHCLAAPTLLLQRNPS